ncbi:uncharacterized protein LOC113309186 [Papaver somniferum]|uniref:uncharacterized protein LOC113309186 n=1 Tax=Papaver somniferum TaxID=3469 RepID=UPI000E6F543D|nr:uncharacterized protein LOC113309186 [Papaver somniferum]XP_026413383.1 uncharacterized protein LOC113309186 [Papaver somniferum]XP_026413384.1 uncharacterized protein LOC113309186 [Papaver somniferum]
MNLFKIESVNFRTSSTRRVFFSIILTFILPLSVFQLLYETDNLFTDQSPNIPRSIIYLGFFFTFYLLSTSAISFTIACLYVSKPVSFLSVLLAIPRIVLRVFITSLCAIFLKTATDVAGYFISEFLIHTDNTMPAAKDVLLMIIESKEVLWCLKGIIFYFFFFIVNGYLTALWHLASVISVTEPNVYGISALKKSRELLRQKTGTTLVIVFCYFACVSLIELNVFLIMDYLPMSCSVRVLLMSLYLIFLMHGNFIGLFVQNALYHGCKSHHNQVIDKKVLYDHLPTTTELVTENGVEDDLESQGWKLVGAE